METARTMWGRIIGDSSTPVSAGRKRVRQRWSGRAARVLTTVETSVVRIAPLTLLTVESIQVWLARYSRYQRSEKRGGGTSRKLEPLNEIGTTTNSGKIKKMPTSTLIAVSATRRAEGRRRRGSRLTAGPEDAVESHHAVGDEEHAQRDEEQEEGERRAYTPVEELRNLLVDEQGDHDVGPAAEQCRRDVVAERGDEDDEPAAHHPGQAEGDEDADERAPGSRAEILGGEQQAGVDAAHAGVQAQDHERQEDVHHPDGHAEAVEEQVERPVAQPQRLDRLVDDTAAPENHHPRVGADEEARPERDEDERPQHRHPAATHRRERVGAWVAQGESDQRHAGGHVERGGEDLPVDRRRQRPRGVSQAADRIGDAHHRELGQRQDEQQREEGEERQQEPAEPPLAGGRASHRAGPQLRSHAFMRSSAFVRFSAYQFRSETSWRLRLSGEVGRFLTTLGSSSASASRFVGPKGTWLDIAACGLACIT